MKYNIKLINVKKKIDEMELLFQNFTFMDNLFYSFTEK